MHRQITLKNLRQVFVKVDIGDIFIRHKGGKVYRVKSIDYKMVTLESCENKDQLILTDVFSLEKGYRKKESMPQ